jgi:hypothetical protein
MRAPIVRASFLRLGGGCVAIALAACAWSCATGVSDDESGPARTSDGGSLLEASAVDSPAAGYDDAGNPTGDDAASPADADASTPGDDGGGGGEDSGNADDAGDVGRDAAARDSASDAEEPDAGSDAGEPDAGHDAGAPDAGHDAGEPDAGHDAGPPDAGNDAGLVDAGHDAGEPDAGNDAGEPDAGHDAAAPDAGSDAGCTPAAVVVNEVQTTGASSAEDEWVELFNPSSCEVDISSWTLKYLAAAGTTKETLWTAPTGTKLGALGYGVIVGTAYEGSAAPIGDLSNGLAEAGGGVAIYDASGTLLDSVGYGTATNAFVQGSAAPEALGGQSIARIPNGVNTHDDAADFSIATTPTPGAAN